MKRIILGTAGHIDHGKTTLIKALTGVDCDRLKEEKQRGITIELGFTSLRLPGGQQAGIIDVPGHEKFVKNMVAGVGGIDALMMVIAADEGVMPQTREHLDICRILSISSGLIVLTKTDMVDEEWIEMVTEDIREYVAGTFLEGAPIVPVSSATGTGIDSLLAELERLVADIAERPDAGLFRLPVDRVFSMKGFGTVVTGTILAGKVGAGEEVEVLPEKTRARVRGIQIHNASSDSATAGMRTALNFQGVEKSALQRGDVITLPGTIAPTRTALARLDHLRSAPRPLKNRARVRFHAGTSEILCRIVLLNRDELQPGQADFVKIVFESPAVLLPHDRYVLRSYSPVTTIGGGEVLDNQPPKLHRFSEITGRRCDILQSGDEQAALLLYCREAGPRGIDLAQIQARCGIESNRLAALVDSLRSAGTIVAFSKNPVCLTLPEVISAVENGIRAQLKDHHARNPLKPGMLREELRGGLPPATNQRLYAHVTERLIKKGAITMTREFLALPEHKPVLQDGQRALRHRIVKLYTDAGRTPPSRKELVETLRIQDREAAAILDLLVREAALVKLSEDIFYESGALRDIVQKTVSHMQETGELTIKGFKELTGLSRKFMIPLFEYLDRTKVTLRMGDKRVLRK